MTITSYRCAISKRKYLSRTNLFCFSALTSPHTPPLVLPGIFLVHHYEAKQIQIVIKKCHKSTDGNHLFGGEFTNQVILSNFEQQQLKSSAYISKMELSQLEI